MKKYSLLLAQEDLNILLIISLSMVLREASRPSRPPGGEGTTFDIKAMWAVGGDAGVAVQANPNTASLTAWKTRAAKSECNDRALLCPQLLSAYSVRGTVYLSPGGQKTVRAHAQSLTQ